MYELCHATKLISQVHSFIKGLSIGAMDEEGNAPFQHVLDELESFKGVKCTDPKCPYCSSTTVCIGSTECLDCTKHIANQSTGYQQYTYRPKEVNGICPNKHIQTN